MKLLITNTVSLMLFGLVLVGAAKAQNLNFNFGADATTNYISKGFTQTENRPALQPYMEVAYGPTYVTFWGSNARFGGVDDVELDVGIGFRPDIDLIDLDFGFVRYFYAKDKANYGEAFVKASYALTSTGKVGLSYWREVYSQYNTFYLNGSISELPWDLTLSGGIGSDFGSRNLSQDIVYGDIGVTKSLSENFSIDLRGNFSAVEGNALTFRLSLFN